MGMRCPICKREVILKGNPFRPFCSERCKFIDLDHWLSGRYRVPVTVESEEQESNFEEAAGSERDELDFTAGE